MAVYCHPPIMFHFDCYITTTWAVSNLVELDIHLSFSKFLFHWPCIFWWSFTMCLLKNWHGGTTLTTCEVHVHQRNCFLLLLAGNGAGHLVAKGIIRSSSFLVRCGAH